MIRHLKFFLLCGFALAQQAQANDSKILILGDSLSAAYGLKKDEGWVHLLQKQLQQQQFSTLVINASISGETSGGGLARLQPLLEQYQPDILVIELGANDGLRGFPVKQLQNNLNALVSAGKQEQCEILLIAVQIPLNYGPRYTQLFNQVFVDIAQQQQIALLPSLLGDIPLQPALMLEDGLHPNASAQPLILQKVWPALEPLLKKNQRHEQ